MRSIQPTPTWKLIAAALWFVLAWGSLWSSSAVAAEPKTAASPAWARLTPQQQVALAPLAGEWQQLPPERRQKWLEIAARFPSMPPDQQARLQRRMSDWAKLSPRQRGQARLNFQQARQVPSQDRRAQWEAYQALPKERREALAREAAHPAHGASAPVRVMRGAPLGEQARKSNIVRPPSAQRPRSVAPTLVQNGPGATTNLVTVKPHPPLHQRSGKLKINVEPTMVDRITLLPKPAAPPSAQPAPAPLPQRPASAP